MISVDTNVLVRLLVNDDTHQGEIAVNIIEQNAIYISKTVLLELEWVLRGCYAIPSAQIATSLEKLISISTVTIEHMECVIAALHDYKQGMDFADALHLASRDQAMKFATFDKKLVKKATQLCVKGVLLCDSL